ncbi:hypothetical protein RIF29_21081 [Crotalaria pallida]|uniref:Uncharacterized protein n=1 Tax=Crotalaria pallida TaxID=3830 RepID=A0AAN9FAW4_CROPI
MYGHRAEMCLETVKNNGCEDKIAVETMVNSNTMDSDVVVQDNGNVDIIKESEDSSQANKENNETDPSAINVNENVMEKPFGPWMLVKRFARNKDHGAKKGGNNKVDSGYKRSQSQSVEPPKAVGSRFIALTEEETNDLDTRNIDQGTSTLHEGEKKITVKLLWWDPLEAKKK